MMGQPVQPQSTIALTHMDPLYFPLGNAAQFFLASSTGHEQ